MSINNENCKYLKIFVGNVPFQCSRDEFIECFNKYDGFIDGDIVNRINSENSRGFGFITFKTQEHADNFLLIREQIILKNRVLRFTRYDSAEKKVFKNNLNEKNYIFIKNVPKEIKPLDIKKIFDAYGEIGSCFVNTNIITGESKGTAVVEIKDNELFIKLLTLKEIALDDKNRLELTRWKQKVKVKKNTIVDTKDIYRVAFNAGRNMGILEGLKIAGTEKKPI